MISKDKRLFLYQNRVILALLLLTLVGLLLRLGILGSKPAWMDEVATTVFSLGNRTQSIPRNQIIDLETFLTPLRPDFSKTIAEGFSNVINNLFAEDNHPPLYFLIAHLWMRLFPSEDGVALLSSARSLPAIFGALSIPLSYGLGKAVFRSQAAALLTATVMTTSPYCIYLSQEVRHYSLAICFVILSLSCMMITAQYLRQKKTIPLETATLWVIANIFGMATHYFFSLAMAIEAIVLLILFWQQQRSSKKLAHWRRLYIVAGLSLCGLLIWTPLWLDFLGSRQTTNVKMDNPLSLLYWINPLAQSLFTWISSVLLLPIEAPQLVICILSGVFMLTVLIWIIPRLIRGYHYQLQQAESESGSTVLIYYALAAVGLFLTISYGLGMDITRGGRYGFVYVPSLITLVGGSLGGLWQLNQRKAVYAFLLIGLLSALTVVADLGYRKFYHPDRLIPVVQANSHHPAVLAMDTPIERKPTVVGIELLSIGWEIARHFPAQTWTAPPQFLLFQDFAKPSFYDLVLQHPRPFDLWLFNRAPDLAALGCPSVGPLKLTKVGSYNYQHYLCQ
jgi:uncharacterized membrane protein